MKKRIITKKITEHYTKCKFCKKEIKGTSESQAIFNLGLHEESCKKNPKNGGEK